MQKYFIFAISIFLSSLFPSCAESSFSCIQDVRLLPDDILIALVTSNSNSIDLASASNALWLALKPYFSKLVDT